MENSQHNILLFLHMQCLEQMLSLRLHHLPVSPPVPLSMVHYSHSLPGRHLRNHSDPQSAISSACKFSVPYLTLATSWGWIKQWLRCCINVRFHGFMVLNRASWFYCNSHMCVCLLNKIVPWFFFGGGAGSTACNAGDPGSIPGSGRSPRQGHGYPLKYSCLENSMDRGAWQAAVHGVSKSQTQLSD